MQWRKVATADYNKFTLIIDDEHKKFLKNDLVYNHKGELLYFYDYNPAEVPVFRYSKIESVFNLDSIHENNKQHGILWDRDGSVNYRMDGTDCSGVPTFSHFTKKNIDLHHHKNANKFKPLTVETVLYWYGWFLYNLRNSKLILK